LLYCGSEYTSFAAVPKALEASAIPGLTPALVSVALASNELFGATGKDAASGVINRDYFAFTVPVGMELSGLWPPSPYIVTIGRQPRR
jgi:hypothetical protein